MFREVALKIKKELEDHGRSESGAVVGVSAGADSFVLLHLLEGLLATGAIRALTIAHVNYGLRGEESDRDEQTLVQYCKNRGLDCRIHKVLQAAPESGVQEWARDIRHEFFETLIEGQDVLFLGHNRDDCAESTLMRLARGVGGGSLCGLRLWNDGVMRPLLSKSKREIEIYAARHSLPICHDSSNDKLIYSRNRIRHSVLPVLEELYPGAKERIVQVGSELEEIVEWCRGKLEEECDLSSRYLSRNIVKDLPRGVAIELICQHIKSQKGAGIQLSRNILYDI